MFTQTILFYTVLYNVSNIFFLFNSHLMAIHHQYFSTLYFNLAPPTQNPIGSISFWDKWWKSTKTLDKINDAKRLIL